MAALTQGAIDGLLGVLSKAITDEAQLIGGVPGDMQFIKDEMDSMNGFLLHLTKTEGQHDDQVRAWMKQVREIAYVAEDCVQRYIHDMVPYEAARCGRLGVLAAMARLFLFHPKKYCQLHDLGKQITELKVRVRDVGKRRMRYGVTVPAGPDLKLAPMTPAGQQEEKRLAFVRVLEGELQQDVVGSEAWWRAQHQAWLRTALRRATAVGGLVPAALPSAVLRYISVSREIVRRLPPLVQSEAATVHGILKKCSSQDDGVDDAAAFRCTKRMFLCALYAYPYVTNRELEKLKEKLEGSRAQDPKKEVMTFCYSMLSISQKSSLQYITAFFHESEISRTSMVRRWVAEGLVGKEPGGGGGGRTPEEEGECCFSELVFRGFIRPARFSDAGTVKSCVMEKPVRDFIRGITGSENFEVSLPAHLERQLKIREIVQQIQPPPQQQEQRLAADRWKNIIARRCNNLCSDNAWPEEDHPMDALVDFLKKLPELYRLNVLDLGGCKGLKRRHLKSFGGVVWLKYLSLRNTDVSHLHASHINKLTLLETLDIRGTSIRPRDTKKINLPKLKHLLAGRYLTPGEKASLITVRMPRKIGSMRCMETLSHVQVSKDGTELRGVAKLRQLRKLGVVVHGNAADSTAHLGPVLHALSGCLRSLSVCVVTTQGWALDEGSSSSTQEMTMAPRPSFILENLDIKGKISGLPSWITKAQKLANVTLRHTELSGEDALRRLASVLSLRCLKLSGGAFTEQQLVFKVVVQFKALKILVLEGGPITTITFLAADVAPALEKIVWAIGSRVRDGEDLIVGINYLPNLKAIELRGDFKTTSLMDWLEATKESTSDPRYRICYMSSTASLGNQLITEVPKTAKHTTVSIPVAAINQH